MALLSKEYLDSHFEKFRWDEARERTPNDYGVPERLSPRNGFKSKEEEAEYWDKLDEMRLDEITY